MPLLQPMNKAAQYVRMSTDHQQYSTLNQKTAIAAYAAERGIDIIATYEDAGKSGLTFSGRPSLRQLIADVAAGQSLFDTILVYDVSRWGRFQDADESAHLEYLCRLSGVAVHYCAEPFANDGSPFASICKVVKRALAAEYSRELSEKVFRGKKRLIELGFSQGSSAGYGLRRCLVDCTGARKFILARGERKSITTDRVILVPGPQDEIEVVSRIYDDFIEREMGCPAIAKALNREGIESESGRPWSRAMIKVILKSEKYIGNSVWNRNSFKLQIARQHNPRENWARADGAFEGIVPPEVFNKAQEVFAHRASVVTNEQIVDRLKHIYAKHGRITARLIKRDRFIGPVSIRNHFGSLIKAYAEAGYVPIRDFAFLTHNEARMRLREATAEALIDGLLSRGLDAERLSGACRFRINSEIILTVTVVQQRQSQRRRPRWIIKPSETGDDLRIAVLMDGISDRARAYYFFPAPELRKQCVLATRNAADFEVFRATNLEPLFDLCVRKDPSARPTSDFDCDPFLLGAVPASLPSRPSRRTIATNRRKTYGSAFKRASKYLRSAIDRAEATSARLDALRCVLSRPLHDKRFVRKLDRAGINCFPYSVLPLDKHAIETQDKLFRNRLRDTARDLIDSQRLSRRGRKMLERLSDRSRLKAAEMIVLVNDTTDAFVHAMLCATPGEGLRHLPPEHVNGISPEMLKAMRIERRYLQRRATVEFARFGRNALDLVAVEAFARRVVSHPDLRSWLERNDAIASTLLAAIDHRQIGANAR